MRPSRTIPALLLAAFAAALPSPAADLAASLPDPRIAGFRFPENEATLTRWITEMTRADPAVAAPAFEKIHLHGWGLWTALTLETRQRYEGQLLRVFETWDTPETLAPDPAGRSAARARPAGRSPLRPLAHLRQAAEKIERLASDEAITIDRVVGFTKFDPTAAAHIAQQDLMSRATLNTLLEGGAQQITPFPPTALAVKPLFQIIRRSELVDGRYYRLKAWSGPPESPKAWAPAQWPDCVWLDVLGGGDGAGAIDSTAAADGRSRTADTTYPLAALIHYQLSAADAAALNRDKPATAASSGDIAILVAMHVSSREIARWTWQTFWWTPAPDTPPAPSSREIAGLRPAELRGAARHYAMSLAYTMLSPDQPYVGGSNRNPAVYAYNPWIEARFAPADLPDSRAGIDLRGEATANNTGVQTNCMSCHVQANYNPRGLATAPRFTGARYIDLSDPQFVGTLQVDFLWSIARHAK